MTDAIELPLDANVQAVIAKHRQRAVVGLRKYGVTTEALSKPDALRHLQEELLDAAVYCEQLMATPPAQQQPSTPVKLLAEALDAQRRGDYLTSEQYLQELRAAQPQPSERAAKELPDSWGFWERPDLYAWISWHDGELRWRPVSGTGFIRWTVSGYPMEDLPRGNWLKAHPTDELARLRVEASRLDTIRKTLPESWYTGLELERRVGYLVKQWRKLYEVVEELKQRAEAAEAELERLRAILLRVCSYVTPLQDGRSEEQHAHAMGESMEQWEKADELVNSSVCDLECQVAQAEQRAEAAEARVAWQPIETAPKDSKAILVWCPENLCCYAVSCGGVTDKYLGHWVIFGGAFSRLCHEPTHWMPLPSPPTQEQRHE